jgi:hypothetical protein
MRHESYDKKVAAAAEFPMRRQHIFQMPAI